MADYKDYLTKIYTDIGKPGAFAGPNKLYEIVRKEGKFKIGRAKIRRFLNNLDTYSLYKPIRKTFSRSRVIVDTINSMWDGDLADMSSISKYNDGYKFLFVLIDVFSRYLFIAPLKDKKHQSILHALRTIFTRGRKPKILRTDKGVEFKNRWVKTFLQDEGVGVIYTQNETKANYAERVIRTMRNLINRYSMKNQTYKYIDVLQKLVATYNSRPHRSLRGMAPQDVTSTNADEVRLQVYLSRQNLSKRSEKVTKKKNFKYKIGDTVRISQLKRTFQKDYEQKWTEEYFKISKRYKRDGIPIYQVEDLAGENLSGTFYEPELQKIVKSNEGSYRVEKIIKRRGRGQNREVLIKWGGWPSKFNSWIPETSLEDNI